MLLTLDVPNELAMRLHPFEQQIPHLLELGLHEINTPKQRGFNGMGEILEFLAQLPSAEEIIALRPAESLQTQVDLLLEKQRIGTLSAEEQQQWQQYEYLEHLVRTAKAHAFLKLKAAV